ncbi:MAG TPA: hypothetical protein VL123_09255, partial [Candidatus Udaeobacter sp.]|nr:hypothetical protein [Candidatus Udaeobacter sp.]
MDPTVIDRLQFDAQALMAEHRPAWRHQNKGIVYDVACPSGAIHRGTLTYTRWQRAPLPENANPSAAADRVAPRAGFYDYEAERDFDTAMEWHVNFADPYLFIGHNSPLFAQDEMQVAEHPALGALRDQFRARGKHPLTEEDGDPTPILIAGIERRCRVAIDR